MATVKKIVRPDTKGRITLGKLAENVSSFEIIVENGKIILEPLIEIPARELWLYKNPEALASLEKGVSEAKAGKVKSRGSFAKYLNEDDPD
ncbi:MAG: hypothetical protein A2Y25_08065 [Candidatus Melainabacteria bacterium GWF2_37_15]|nr:MAG: hypothetical protein A2Y25_08065 [Candidatus Melainabacteria bacterium GWF2_37_15]